MTTVTVEQSHIVKTVEFICKNLDPITREFEVILDDKPVIVRIDFDSPSVYHRYGEVYSSTDKKGNITIHVFYTPKDGIFYQRKTDGVVEFLNLLAVKIYAVIFCAVHGFDEKEELVDGLIMTYYLFTTNKELPKETAIRCFNATFATKISEGGRNDLLDLCIDKYLSDRRARVNELAKKAKDRLEKHAFSELLLADIDAKMRVVFYNFMNASTEE